MQSSRGYSMVVPPLQGGPQGFENLFSLLKPLKKNATPEETEEYNKAAEKMKPKVNFIVC